MAIPKKDGRIRMVCDFRELNKVIKRKVHPLSNINELLRKHSGHEFLTKLDISMQHCTFELDEESKDLCTIITPFGKCKWNKLPMGVSCAPDIAQSVMSQLFCALDQVSCFLDDIGVFDSTFDSHMESLDKVLKNLQDNNFTVNPLKCEWAIKETDQLGYWLTPQGLKPWKKKMDAILNMEAPKNV